MVINYKIWAALFVGCLIYDYVNAKYIRAVAEYDKFKAANTSLFLVVVGGLFTYEYVNNLWNLIPIAIGCWFGTYLSFYEDKWQRVKLLIAKVKRVLTTGYTTR